MVMAVALTERSIPEHTSRSHGLGLYRSAGVRVQAMFGGAVDARGVMLLCGLSATTPRLFATRVMCNV